MYISHQVGLEGVNKAGLERENSATAALLLIEPIGFGEGTPLCVAACIIHVFSPALSILPAHPVGYYALTILPSPSFWYSCTAAGEDTPYVFINA